MFAFRPLDLVAVAPPADRLDDSLLTDEREV